MAGFTDFVTLRSVMIFRVVGVRQSSEESLHLIPTPELFGDVLKALATAFDWNRLSYWLPGKGDSSSVQLLASRGVLGADANKSAFELMNRLAVLVAADRRVIRLRNIRSQMKYAQHTYSGNDHSDHRLPTSFFAFPIVAFDSLIGIVCCEEVEAMADTFDRLADDMIMMLSRKLGEKLTSIGSVSEQDREQLFTQVIERTMLEWSKANDPFHTVLSPRERQVSMYVARGHTNAEIAKALFVSTRTVTTHLERIFQKLQVTSRASLTRYIVENGFCMMMTRFRKKYVFFPIQTPGLHRLS